MKLLRQTILLTLALLVLISSTGMAVGVHFCGGELRDVTFFGNKADCPMEQPQQAMPPCHAAQKYTPKKKSCCEDHQLEVKRLDQTTDGKALILHPTLNLKFVAAFHAVILQLFAPAAAQKPAFALYTSPPLARDIPVLTQSFLL